MAYQDFMKALLFLCMLVMLLLFLWILCPKVFLSRDPESGRFRIHVRPRTVLHSNAFHPRHSVDEEIALERALLSSRRHMMDPMDDDNEPLPAYTLRGLPGSGAYVDCRSPITAIDEMQDGSIVVRSMRPVLASAGVPILPAGHGNPVPGVSRRSLTSLAPATALMEHVSPSVLPSGSLPVVHLSMSLPPPPRYGDKCGVMLESGLPAALQSGHCTLVSE